jgi:phosphonate transport system substrate-binding protein
VTAFTNDQVQLAWFGGFTGVQARRAVPGSEAIAQGAEDVAFKSYVIANARTGLEPGQEFPKGLVGRSFTFGARASTSGRLMPEFFFRQNTGKSPDELFSRVGFSGDHSRTVQLVQSGAYEAGVLDYSVWETERRTARWTRRQVRVIWETPTYPDYNWTVAGRRGRRLRAGFKDRLAAALLAIDDPAILASFARSKLHPGKNADYAPSRRSPKQAPFKRV